MSACQCSTCSHSSSSRDEEFYMYREKKGKSVFTGFIRKGDEIYWVGKDELSMRHINTKNPEDINFFMAEMKQYD